MENSEYSTTLLIVSSTVGEKIEYLCSKHFILIISYDFSTMNFNEKHMFSFMNSHRKFLKVKDTCNSYIRKEIL